MAELKARARSGVRIVACLAVVLGGCAAAQQISRGDELLQKDKYGAAVAAYEKALRISPDNEGAKEGIRTARREAVRAELRKAKQMLTKGEYAKALIHGLRARRMPLDLDEVTLANDIDDTVAKTSRRAEETVAKWSDAGLFIPAVGLADQVVRASPGVESRRKWGDEVRANAVKHFAGLARDFESAGMPGSAAMQLAMAKRVGATVPVTKVAQLWDQFTEPICFAVPQVEVHDVSHKAGKVVAALENAAREELDRLRSRCGEGTRPLGVTIELASAEVIDRDETQQAAKALPGSDFQTVEIYYDERPYTVDEEYTEYEVRTEKQEKRDCAPRPGKPRGCVTWVEDAEVKVPIKKTRRVQKIERIKKTRPAKGPFPPDEVVTYEVQTITRRVKLAGTVQVTNAVGAPGDFTVDLESTDSANEEVRHPKMLVRADPMIVKTLDELLGEAALAVSAEVKATVAGAVAGWSQSEAEQARQRVREGKLPEAEELYLRLIALGATDDPHLEKFFVDRYGKSVSAVIDLLFAALGHEAMRRRPGEEEGAGTFPKHGSAVAEPEPKSKTKAIDANAPHEKTEADVSKMAEDELRALEEASLEDAKKGGDQAPPSGSEVAKPGIGSEEDAPGDPPAGGTAPESGSDSSVVPPAPAPAEGDSATVGDVSADPKDAPRGPVTKE